MCLAVPMELTEIREDGSGVTTLSGTTTACNLSLVPEAKLGDMLIVHAGFAIEILDTEEADKRIALFEKMGEEADAFEAGESPEIGEET